MMSILLMLLMLPYRIVCQIDLPQSHIVMSEIGYYFSPYLDVEWLDDMYVSSFEECIHQCNQNVDCRTFDYNVTPNECRLFQVEPSPGQIAYDHSYKSQLGYVELAWGDYSGYNQTCDQCEQKRYLICDQNICRCPWNTFWDGSICQKQKYAGDLCNIDEECNAYNYNLTCVLSNVCTSAGYPTNICARNQNLVLFNYTTNTVQPYILYSFNFTAITTSVTVTFSLKSQNAIWVLSNISLIDVNTGVPVLNNGDFGTGNLNNWNYCNPNFTNNSSKIGNGSLSLQNGQYYYFGAPYPYPDFLSQTVSTTIGDRYTLSFWLRYTASSSNNRFIVTIVS